MIFKRSMDRVSKGTGWSRMWRLNEVCLISAKDMTLISMPPWSGYGCTLG